MTGPVREPGRPIYTTLEIAAAVERLASTVAADYAGQPLLVLGVLKGALYLTVDLTRALAAISGGPSEIMVDYICVSSYGASNRSSGELRVLLEPAARLEGWNVLMVDDIADTGLTLERLGALLEQRSPASLHACVLFDKPARRRSNVPLRYVGLPVGAHFVVGYGLDYQELYRTLPHLTDLDYQIPSAKESQRFQPRE